MINFDEITGYIIPEHNPKWTKISHHPLNIFNAEAFEKLETMIKQKLPGKNTFRILIPL